MQTNRGLFSPIRVAESGYQRASRGGNQKSISSDSNLFVAKHEYYHIDNNCRL